MSTTTTAAPAVFPWVDGNTVISIAAHPTWGTVHLVVLATDWTWRILCQGTHLTEDWALAARDGMEVTCEACWQAFHPEGAIRRATGRDQTFFAY